MSGLTSPLIEVVCATKRFGELVAVNEVSFTVDHLEIVGLVGPNGAGKSTLIDLISGALKPNSGEVRFRTNSINPLGPEDRARLGIGRTFQIPKPFLALSVLENVMVGAFLHERRLRRACALAMKVLEIVGLSDRAGRQAGELSLTEQRRLEVARALALEPDIILLDEVMAGLNTAEIDASIALFRTLHELGLAFLVIEQNPKVIRALSERVVVLDHGTLIAQGRTTEVLERPDVIEACLGQRRH